MLNIVMYKCEWWVNGVMWHVSRFRYHVLLRACHAIKTIQMHAWQLCRNQITSMSVAKGSDVTGMDDLTMSRDGSTPTLNLSTPPTACSLSRNGLLAPPLLMKTHRFFSYVGAFSLIFLNPLFFSTASLIWTRSAFSQRLVTFGANFNIWRQRDWNPVLERTDCRERSITGGAVTLNTRHPSLHYTLRNTLYFPSPCPSPVLP